MNPHTCYWYHSIIAWGFLFPYIPKQVRTSQVGKYDIIIMPELKIANRLILATLLLKKFYILKFQRVFGLLEQKTKFLFSPIRCKTIQYVFFFKMTSFNFLRWQPPPPPPLPTIFDSLPSTDCCTM